MPITLPPDYVEPTSLEIKPNTDYFVCWFIRGGFDFCVARFDGFCWWRKLDNIFYPYEKSPTSPDGVYTK